MEDSVDLKRISQEMWKLKADHVAKYCQLKKYFQTWTILIQNRLTCILHWYCMLVQTLLQRLTILDHLLKMTKKSIEKCQRTICLTAEPFISDFWYRNNWKGVVNNMMHSTNRQLSEMWTKSGCNVLKKALFFVIFNHYAVLYLKWNMSW